ncbi:MAG: alpha/beta fold hydrolase [Thermoanaerobaculia bacterium]
MRRISVGDLELAFVDRGAGPVILLVHGFPLDHSMWSEQIDVLAIRNRVIASDLRGFGESDGRDETTTMRQFADDLASLLEALDIRERITLCGLSMGGYVAWQFWKHHRDRLTSLILCDTRAACDTPEGALGRLALAKTVLAEGALPVADSMLPKLFAPRNLDSDPPYVASTKQVMESTRPTTIAATLRGMAERPDMTAELPNIELPALLLCGEHDDLTPADEMRDVAKAMPDAMFRVIYGAGHMSPLERPERVNRLILEFL